MTYALHPITFGETPLSSNYANHKACLNLFGRLACPEKIPNYEIIKKLKIQAGLEQFLDEIKALRLWSKDWDNYGSAKPRVLAIKNAMIWGKKIYFQIIKNEYEWRMPFINADEDGNIVLEWWYQDRNLTLDISSHEVMFFETRNADSSPTIVSGILTDKTLLFKLRWLILGE